MHSSPHNHLLVAAWVSVLLFASLSGSVRAQEEKLSRETTNMTVLVKEYNTGAPINQARITLTFTEPVSGGLFAHGRKISYDAKTDTQGRYKFQGINKGTIVLRVTAPSHQTYGQELKLEKDNQVFEVKLKKPQPLI